MSIRIILKSGKDKTLLSRHPWVFSGAIKQTDGHPEAGDQVSVFDNQGNLLGRGTFGTGSIAVRMLTFDDQPIDDAFWKSRVQNALTLRKNLGIGLDTHTDVYRLIHGEGDHLPGLIADYYNGVVVMQFHSIGMYRYRELIARQLKDLLGTQLKGIYDKSAGTLHHREAQHRDEWLMGTPIPEIEVKEKGMRLLVHVEEGQKTGFFIDQRENRHLVRQMAEGKKVLNTFAYTGGFSVAAALGGATEVHSVDSSKTAMALCEKNMSLNNTEAHTAIVADVFDYLKNMPEDFDVIVLDPPAFAKHLSALSKGLQGYKNINYLALQKIKKGGLLFTFSCSQVVSEMDFRKAVFLAAAQTRRNIRVIQRLQQPADHPVDLFHPQGEYLKGLALYVD
jgi:23S rRNA (cytosine1962-C5)-methyltransferase